MQLNNKEISYKYYAFDMSKKLKLMEKKEQEVITAYLNKKIKNKKNILEDYHCNIKKQGDTNLIQIGSIGINKTYTILLYKNNYVCDFLGKVHLLDEKNILQIYCNEIRLYKLSNSKLTLINIIPISSDSIGLKEYGKNVIIGNKIYSIEKNMFISPNLDEIITKDDPTISSYVGSTSIIDDKDVCPEELRIAIDSITDTIDIGIKKITADNPLISITETRYLETLSILLIINKKPNMNIFLWYNPITKKIVTEKLNKEEDFTQIVKKQLDTMTETINEKRLIELEQSLYFNTMTSVADILPKGEQQKLIETMETREPGLSKIYKPRKEQ